MTGQPYRTTLGQGPILFGTTFLIKHELRNGECTALPGGRASVKGEPLARRIGRHHGKRHCHVSLECLKLTVPLTDLLVLQGHLCPIGSRVYHTKVLFRSKKERNQRTFFVVKSIILTKGLWKSQLSDYWPGWGDLLVWLNYWPPSK